MIEYSSFLKASRSILVSLMQKMSGWALFRYDCNYPFFITDRSPFTFHTDIFNC